MMDKLPQAILIVQDGCVIYVNAAANQLILKAVAVSSPINLSRQQLVETVTEGEGRSTAEVFSAFQGIVSQQQSLSEFLKSGLGESESKQYLFQYADRDRVERRLKAELCRISFDTKKSTVCILEDLTVSLQLERETLNKKFEKIFLSSFTHELLTPLNGILGVVDLLDAEESEDPETRKKNLRNFVQTIRSTCKVLLYLIQDVMYMAKEGQGSTLSQNEEQCDLSGVIDECRQLLAFGFQQKHISLSISMGTSAPPQLRIDRVKYRQVLLHLMGNALKYTMDGGVTITTSYDSQAGRLVTTVADTGVGIPQKCIDTLFRLFGELDKTCELNPQGIGLGLSICQKYTRSMGGSLSVASVEGRGTTFTFSVPTREPRARAVAVVPSFDADERLPSREDVDEEVVLRRPYGSRDVLPRVTSESKQAITLVFPEDVCRQEPQEKCGCGKFLIVDDNELNRFVLRGLLLKMKFSCDEAVNGKMAVEMVRARSHDRYAIIFMDINMPVMDGVEATKLIKAMVRKDETQFSPVVAVTAAVCRDECEKESYFRAGFDEFGTIQTRLQTPRSGEAGYVDQAAEDPREV